MSCAADVRAPSLYESIALCKPKATCHWEGASRQPTLYEGGQALCWKWRGGLGPGMACPRKLPPTWAPGVALDPLASLEPIGQWARFGEGFYMQSCVGRVDHRYPGVSVGHLLPTSCGQFSVLRGSICSSRNPSLDSW